MPKRAIQDALAHPEDFQALCRRAFADYGAQALWNMRPIENPAPADVLAITKALRTHGDMDMGRNSWICLPAKIRTLRFLSAAPSDFWICR
jgi:hypothetical protein